MGVLIFAGGGGEEEGSPRGDHTDCEERSPRHYPRQEGGSARSGMTLSLLSPRLGRLF